MASMEVPVAAADMSGDEEAYVATTCTIREFANSSALPAIPDLYATFEAFAERELELGKLTALRLLRIPKVFQESAA